MTARREAERGADGDGREEAAAVLLDRLAAIREASRLLRLDPRDSTELLRELREIGVR